MSTLAITIVTSDDMPDRGVEAAAALVPDVGDAEASGDAFGKTA